MPADVRFPRLEHNHSLCIKDALADADKVCGSKGVRLTPQRRAIFEIVWSSHKPIGAYEILEILAKKTKSRPAPMTVYRALDFLIEQCLVHRIASLNAYMGCSHPGKHHGSCFLICDNCGQAAQIVDDKFENIISQEADRVGFTINLNLVEVSGVCSQCQAKT
tara:strand:- start:859 stop:1347 length:489 start_codon:yes stop_codon:yes gene_type:complete